jgi:hypothetical protein
MNAARSTCSPSCPAIPCFQRRASGSHLPRQCAGCVRLGVTTMKRRRCATAIPEAHFLEQ